MRVLIEGWDAGEPVRALLNAPDASQVRAAERVTLQFGMEEASTRGNSADAETTPSQPRLSVLLVQQPHLLTRTPPLLSAVVWDCGLALAEWLVEKEAARRRKGKEEEAEIKIVELGAGAGAPGLAAAASGLASAVLLTDVQQALRGLKANVTRNRLGEKVAVAELDWSRESRGGGAFDLSASSNLFAASPGSSPFPDLVLSADVCYPPPPSKARMMTEEQATAVAESSAGAWASAAASLCGPRTRVLVAFEGRVGGVPSPEVLRPILLREARRRFGKVERLDASGMAFAGGANLELYEFSGCKK